MRLSAPRAGAALVFIIGGCKVHGSATLTVDDASVNSEAAATEPTPSSSDVRIRRQGDQLLHEDGEINFETDKAELKGDRTYTTLRAYANVLRKYPEVRLRIEGHTDSRGSKVHNRGLSDDRARAVRDWLVENGIVSERLEAVGHGEEVPKKVEPPECLNKQNSNAPESCEARAWSHNRRSEFHIVAGAETVPEGDVEVEDVAPVPSPGRDVARTRFQHAFYSGPYLYLSPAFFQAPVANPDETDARRLSYRWGLGGGYLWRRDRFFAALGLGLSHVPISFRTDSDRCTAIECEKFPHDVFVTAELRLGGGSRRVLGYALLAPGVAIGRSRRTAAGTTETFNTGGFVVEVGAGLWGLAWRGLFLGPEVGVSAAFFTADVSAFHDRARSAGLVVRAIVGWHFGWRAAVPEKTRGAG